MTEATCTAAVVGALGPAPQRFIAADASLTYPGSSISGAMNVATALRELTCGAGAIDVEWSDDHAVASWPIAGAYGTPRIVCRLDVCDGTVRTITAARYD